MKHRRLVSLALSTWIVTPLFVAACAVPGPGDDGGDDDVPVEPCQMPPMSTAVATLSGCGDPGTADGPRGTARFANPTNVAIGPDGNLYVADFDSDRVRVVEPDGRARTLVAFAGFQRPFGLAFDGGVLYVQTDDNDAGQHSRMTGTVWRVDPATGDAEVIARDLGRPRGLAVLPDGRIAMADYMHHVVRVLDPRNGQVANLAGAFDDPGYADGRGGAARFNGPYHVAVLADGRLAVTDYFNHRIRVVSLAGDVTSFAGTGAPGNQDGPRAGASFHHPQGLVADGAGNLFVTDAENFAIRRIGLDGQVETLTGGGSGGWRDGDLSDAEFFGMEGLDVASDGRTLWVADGSRGESYPYHRVRIVRLP